MQRAGVRGPTYTEEEALVFLDGPQAAQEARHHDDGAYGDDQVGCRQRREAGGEGGKVALGHGQPDAHSKQPAATELEREESLLDALLLHSPPGDPEAPCPHPNSDTERGEPGCWPDRVTASNTLACAPAKSLQPLRVSLSLSSKWGYSGLTGLSGHCEGQSK